MSTARVAGLNRRFRVVPVATGSALNSVRGMPFRWALNPYRGCSHACKYCYARITHEYLGFNSAGDFERILLAKLDAPAKLAQELARPGWRRELVAVGTATDPYQPVEGRMRLTARCLEVFRRFATPVSLVTKSTLVVRDAQRLAALASAAPGTAVWITVTTVDARLARALEPGAPPPEKRLKAVACLAAQGVPVGVLVAPVLPGLTDGDEALRSVLAAARRAGAFDARMNVLRLCDGAREVYGEWLARFRPDLMPLYRRLYAGGAYASGPYAVRLQARFEALRAEAGFAPGGCEDGTAGETVRAAQQLDGQQLDRYVAGQADARRGQRGMPVQLTFAWS